MNTTELEDPKHHDESSSEDGDVSGRWIRDQLRDVADYDAPADQDGSVLEQATAEALGGAAAPTPQVEPSEPNIYADMADKISKALLGPIQGIEERRSGAVRDLESKLSDALQRIEGLVEKNDSVALQHRDTALRIDGIESGLRHDADELSASIVQLRAKLEELSSNMEQLGGRIETQNNAVDGLSRLEGRRQDSLQRMATAASEFHAAVSQLSQDSAEGVWTAEPSTTNDQ